ncbi:MAG: hypothetical protein UH854_04430 [Clostridia bacterium]|nr:hypothetical protein [Clostridia bacterium]
MIKKNFKFLLTYLLGILASIFLTLAFGWLFDFSHILFSSMTALVTFLLLYNEVWKFGRNDTVKKENSIWSLLLSLSFFILIAVIIEIAVAICKAIGAEATLFYVNMLGMLWFYPFTGFYTESTFLVITPIVALIIILVCAFSYYMGVKNFSFADKIVTRRNKKFEEKKEKHFAEIERIKEQYRNKD